MFTAKTYTERRKALREKVDGGVLLFLGNDEAGINFKDNVYPYRQDSTFLYFFGISQPGLVGVIDESGEAVIFGEERTINHIIWEGNQPSLAEKATTTGVQQTKSGKALSSYLTGKTVHFLPPYRPEHTLKLAEWLSQSPQTLSDKHSVELIKAVIALRSYKSPEEIEEIEKAVNVTVDMHLAAMQGAKPGLMESQVVSLVHSTAIASGGNLSFPIIGTVNGQILHNHYHGNRLAEGDLFLCDSGAETAMGYAGDMTRTFPVDTTFSSRQKEIYDIVWGAHGAACKALRPGIPYKDIHLLTAEHIATGLKQVGIMKGDVKEAVQEGAHALFFPHGLGHMLGLDVHDMENLGENYIGYTDQLKRSSQFGLSALRLGRELEENFVITVEPGIYFIPELIDLWAKDKKLEAFIDYQKLETYKDFGGIRIEDDMLITSEGSRLLGKPLAKTTEEIEEIRQATLAYPE